MQVAEARSPSVAPAGADASYTDRIARLRAQLLASPYDADIERARYVTRSYQATEGEPPCLRAAKALREALGHMTITIGDDERLVGAKTLKTVAGPLGIERTFVDRVNLVGMAFHGKTEQDLSWLDQGFGGGPRWLKELLNMPAEWVREMRDEINPYWRSRNLNSLMRARWQSLGLLSDEVRADRVAMAADMQGHVSAGLKKVLDLGFAGIADQARVQRRLLADDAPRAAERQDFLDAVVVSAEAVRAFAERYAALAEAQAAQLTGARQAELRAIAERCRRVPWQPPRDLAEAVQSIWMTQVALAISYGEDSIFAPGRVDQYLAPYYEADLAASRSTPEQAMELLEEYLIKLSTFVGFGPNNLTLGGTDAEGRDAVNAVSYLIVEAYHRLKGLRNGLAVRIAPGVTPRDFLVQACRTHQRTAGVAFYNDAVVVPDLQRDGYSLADARDYSVIGCAELTSTGNNNGYTSGSTCHFEAVLEMALNEGQRYAKGWKLAGVATPPVASMTSFDDVLKAVEVQLANSVAMMVKLVDAKDAVFAESFPTPLLSSTIEGCVESGHDITRGGAKYNHGAVSAHGVGMVANALAAIRWAVFEQQILTLPQLVQHLREDFQGAEELRLMLQHKAPKYGNNEPSVDALVVWLLERLDTEARKHRRPMDGGPYRALMISAGGQVLAGLAIGATADGRRARAPVSNGISPANGTEREGLTAILQSVAKASRPALSCGSSLNVTLNPLSIRSDENVDKLAGLVQGYFALGGRQVQFNPMGRETLKDAQRNPQDYPDLMVKVSGYSYRFVDLSKGLQDDIIARTEFDIG